MAEDNRLPPPFCMCWFYNHLHISNNIFKAGLFAGVGAVTLVESYKWLSPDSGDETVDLLGQLVNVTQKISLTPGNGESFKRTFDIVAVNIIIFTSMAICVVCAGLVTLIQQWAQRFLALAGTRDTVTQEERAHVQESLYRCFVAVQVPWIPIVRMGLHTSIALYALGILLFISHIDRHLVPIALVQVSTVLFGYTALTILPIFFLNFPYSTPFSAPVWWIWNFWLAVIFWIIANLFSCLLPGRLGLVQSLQDRADKHRKRCADGLEKTVERFTKGHGHV